MNNKTFIARKLRNNLTEAEKRLWYFLRKNNLGVRFRRQQPIGLYFPDFVCLEKHLILEIDGGQHSNSDKDKARDEFFKNEGFVVIRFWNNEVLGNIEGVLWKIREYLKITPTLPPPSRGRNDTRLFI